MSTAASIPPPLLREGDRLTSDEFLRRWEAMPDLKHAELIDGTVHMASPLSLSHGDIHSPLTAWLVYYSASTPGCWPATQPTWIMSKHDVPQPDTALRILPEFGGQSRREGIYGSGAPELIVEVTVSSRSRDLGSKLRLYERTGVREYITALVREQRVVWWELVEGRYREIAADEDGLLRSRVFPGLWLDPGALWSRDLAGLFAAVDRGVASAEHGVFVKLLESRKE